ncbi:hypothetical protein LTR56_012935 [Elasticomyces elasticus]|nr:hypothetical protein LTR56_012935 [Elasticomyces elasticus]KAK3667995.1 hypothetical protein LTR22_001062 [Elasticomyces elasticus]KAK4925064.1 hypothetical protein LTR49_007837 [Elasticomyces elasticus]
MTAQAVLDTPELLETILVRLDAKNLLRVQRVSKMFYSNIKASIRLQRLLWTSPRKHDPKAPITNYNFNPLIDDRCHRLGLEKMLQWKLDKQKGVIVDVYWRTWGDVVDGKKRSCDNMLVLQPTRPMEIQWSVGFFEEMAPGKSIWKGDRRKQWTFKWEDGRLPTLGELREAVLERFGVVDQSSSHEMLDEEAEPTDGQSEMV